MKIPPIEDQRAMRETDFFDPRNIKDEFKGLETEVVKSILNMRSSELVICCSNVIKDFNFGSVVRSANGFGVDKVVFAGRKSYNRRGTVGAHRYMNIEHFSDFADAISTYRILGHNIVAAEYDEKRMQFDLSTYEWEPKTFLIFGEEGRGLEPEILDLVDEIVYIKMHGSVRSFNVASAASIFMYDYNCKVN